MSDATQFPEVFESPLARRNASPEMAAIWSPRRRFLTWRRIWLALAESQRELGVPIPADALEAMRRTLDQLDARAAEAHEARLRHDVMAHVHAWGDVAPAARGIIHLGATSQDVVCNADTLLLRDALQLVARKLAQLVDRTATFASTWRAQPTLGYTHFQPAQPVTVGKRATLWGQDFALALAEVESRLDGLRLRGFRGATGTQASYLALFKGDAAAVDRMEAAVAARLEWPAERTWTVVGQTYPRLVDAQLLSALAVAAAAIHKAANDLRLLAHLKEVEEPFESEQVGSSAMPYKRNPMRCERATGLARLVMSLAPGAFDTASTQWMERTLDDSSHRRVAIPEAFLALDGALDVMVNVLGGLVVHPKVIEAHLAAELPFMVTEDLLMAMAKAGADRQEAHEMIRRHAHAAGARVKEEGLPNDLLERLAADPLVRRTGVDPARVADASALVGRAASQVDAFVSRVAEPIRARYRPHLAREPRLRV